MAKQEVRRVVKVNYEKMSDDKLREIYGLRDLKIEQECTDFDDGEGYVCLKDLDDGPDYKDYAVYSKGGRLLCLLCDCSVALDGYEDWEYGDKRNELYRQIALLAGWPESMHDLNVGMTWRQLIAQINEFPKEFLDTAAYVCMDNDGNLEPVADVQAWYADGKPVDDNCLYIDLVRNKDKE